MSTIYVNLVGSVVDGKFLILSRLGAGSSGDVFVAEQIEFNRRVALKLFKMEMIGDSQAVERFTREGKVLCALNHVNLCRFLVFGFWGTRPYIAMELCQGQTLLSLLENGKKLDPRRAIAIVVQCCGGLSQAHQNGIIHRDITASNIIVDSQDQVKLLDFGLAKLLEPAAQDQALTIPGSFLGTPLYASPEQCLAEEVTPSSDIYALGGVLFHCLTGAPLFPGDGNYASLMYKHVTEPPPLFLLQDQSAMCNTVLDKALKKCPQERFESIEAMSEALKDVMMKLDSAVTASSPVSDEAPQRQRRWLTMAGAMSLVALCIASLSLVMKMSEPRQLLLDGQSLYQKRRYPASESKFQQAITRYAQLGELNTDHGAEAIAWLAIVLRDSGKFVAAEREFDKALSRLKERCDQQRTWVYTAAARNYQLQGKTQLAQDYLSMALLSLGDSSGACDLLPSPRSDLELRQLRKIIDDCEHAGQKGSRQWVVATGKMARIFRQSSQYAEAQDLIDRAISNSAKDAELNAWLSYEAACNCKLGNKVNMALLHFAGCLDAIKSTQHGESVSLQIQVLHDAALAAPHGGAIAAELEQRALDLVNTEFGADSSEVLVERRFLPQLSERDAGIVLLANHQYKQAEAKLRNAISEIERHNGRRSLAWLSTAGQLGALLTETGRYTEAEKTIDSALSCTDGNRSLNSYLYLGAARNYAAEKNYKKAQASYSQAMAFASDETLAEVLELSARAYVDEGDFEHAIEQQRKTVRVASDLLGSQSTEVRSRSAGLALMLLEDGARLQDRQVYNESQNRLEQSIALYEQLDDKASSQWKLAVTHLGWVLSGRGQYKAAEYQFLRAIANNKEQIGNFCSYLYLGTGRNYLAQRKYEMAQHYFTLASVAAADQPASRRIDILNSSADAYRGVHNVQMADEQTAKARDILSNHSSPRAN